jgi:hypothetical protein
MAQALGGRAGAQLGELGAVVPAGSGSDER